MSVTIKRRTGWLGSFSNITVLLNGEKVAKIADYQVLELSIQNKNADLQVTQYGFKSNKISVTEGNMVEITATKSSYILYYTIVLFILLLSISTTLNVIPLTTYSVLLLLGFLLFIGSFFFVTMHNLKVINQYH
ncbi:hypothetical protein BW727_200019 (plasmid) [Jeotgalibaca dankookensis]|uniref:Uncharacterized protein n=1 Tax=Jeotgalibaca dankookensis TaxID=708126 RepID=A0A1S6ISA3_9LACT|nr:hypothetical protein [Jeotgalibaca dankookensis]AQS54422.1 hypothetical protein BW727_200019 [Jeotgalibaca dankookensis]